MSRLERITLEDWLERALTAKGSVEMLAESCGVTPRHLQRYIRNRWGVVPVRWLNKVRLRHAPALLKKGVKIKEVATALGYGDASHFAKAFRGHYGVPPSRFRKADQ